MNAVQGDLRSAVAEIVGRPAADLGPGAGLHETPGWDSFAQVEIMALLGERFGIEVSDDTIRRYSTLAAIVALEGGAKT